MTKAYNFLFFTIFFVFILTPIYGESALDITEKDFMIGNEDAKITIIEYASLSCSHCADFHVNTLETLKKEYIDSGVVKFEHHSFPLDLAALNAEIIVRCHLDSNKSFQLLGEIYKKQSQWAVGSDINIINESIKKIGLDSGLKNNKMDDCLNSEIAQDEILNERIEAQKQYKIQSTPTIYINKKKYKGEHKYKPFKKAIEKLL